MAWDLVAARYGMLMDVMSMTASQSPSGEIQRSWEVTQRDIPCYARGLRATGTRLAGTGERWGTVYDDVNTIKIHAQVKLDKSDRVTNIRDVNGNVVWSEPTDSPTVFDVTGSSPVIEPFNNTVEYDMILTRADPQ